MVEDQSGVVADFLSQNYAAFISFLAEHRTVDEPDAEVEAEGIINELEREAGRI